eukprot:jgi/Bigna1/78287/fgenesh1_pg.53_\
MIALLLPSLCLLPLLLASPVSEQRARTRLPEFSTSALPRQSQHPKKLVLPRRLERNTKLYVTQERPPLDFTDTATAGRTPDVKRAPLSRMKRGYTPSEAVLGMYNAFNDRNAKLASSFLTEDCLYEDLLLGPATICRGKKAFEEALRYHPAFVMGELDKYLPFKAPDFHLVVDSVAEGEDSGRVEHMNNAHIQHQLCVFVFLTVGVEWHVEVNRKPFPMGRGLTQARICSRTGKICRVVDIAEVQQLIEEKRRAPWRVIGLFTAPLVQFLFRPYVNFKVPWLKHNHQPRPQPKPVVVPVNPRLPKRHRG